MYVFKAIYTMTNRDDLLNVSFSEHPESCKVT